MSTKISWANETWNPVTGCTHVSEGCRHCYAERLSQAHGTTKKPWTAQNEAENIVLHAGRLDKPKEHLKGKRFFVNSMSDLFHPRVPDWFITKVFDAMIECPQHIFLILTKRPERAAKWAGPWAKHIALGVSVEDARVVDRIDILRQSQAAIKFISFEPLIGSVGKVDLRGIAWAIVGGESGPGFRPMDHTWARSIRKQCVENNVAFFFKQSAGVKSETGTELIEADGSRQEWRDYPTVLNPVQVDESGPTKAAAEQLSLL